MLTYKLLWKISFPIDYITAWKKKGGRNEANKIIMQKANYLANR